MYGNAIHLWELFIKPLIPTTSQAKENITAVVLEHDLLNTNFPLPEQLNENTWINMLLGSPIIHCASA